MCRGRMLRKDTRKIPCKDQDRDESDMHLPPKIVSKVSEVRRES